MMVPKFVLVTVGALFGSAALLIFSCQAFDQYYATDPDLYAKQLAQTPAGQPARPVGSLNARHRLAMTGQPPLGTESRVDELAAVAAPRP